MKKSDLKILLVDDEPDIVEILSYNLGKEGYQIFSASNGKEALKKINQNGIKRKQVGVEIDCSPLSGPNTTFWELKKDNISVGKITSAVYSPRLKKNIALAMVSIEHSEIGNKFQVITNEGAFNCVIVEKPFYDPKKKIANS